MYARLSRLETPPNGLDELGRFEEESVQLLCDHSGYRGYVLLAEPAGGTCVTITYWESEAAMQACDELAARRHHPCLSTIRGRSVERLRLIREG